MRRHLRNPLVWMIVAEAAVVSALVIVAWNVLNLPAGGAAAAPQPLASAAATDSPSPTPVDPVGRPSPTARGLLPGLNLDSDFWRLRLLALNKDEVLVEQLEWRIVHSAMETIHRYLDTVVLPAITRAERGGG